MHLRSWVPTSIPPTNLWCEFSKFLVRKLAKALRIGVIAIVLYALHYDFKDDIHGPYLVEVQSWLPSNTPYSHHTTVPLQATWTTRHQSGQSSLAFTLLRFKVGPTYYHQDTRSNCLYVFTRRSRQAHSSTNEIWTRHLWESARFLCRNASREALHRWKWRPTRSTQLQIRCEIVDPLVACSADDLSKFSALKTVQNLSWNESDSELFITSIKFHFVSPGFLLSSTLRNCCTGEAFTPSMFLQATGTSLVCVFIWFNSIQLKFCWLHNCHPYRNLHLLSRVFQSASASLFLQF